MINYLIEAKDVEDFEDKLVIYGYEKVNSENEHELYATHYYSDNEYQLIPADYTTIAYPLYKGNFLEYFDEDKLYVNDEGNKIVGPTDIIRESNQKLSENGYYYLDDFNNEIEKLLKDSNLELDENVSITEVYKNMGSVNDIVKKMDAYKKLVAEKEELKVKQKLETISPEKLLETIDERQARDSNRTLSTEDILKENIYFISEKKDSLIKTLESLSSQGYRGQHQSTWRSAKPAMHEDGVFKALKTGSDFDMLTDWKVEQLQKDNIPIVINPILRLAHFTIPTQGIGLDAAVKLPEIERLYCIRETVEREKEKNRGIPDGYEVTPHQTDIKIDLEKDGFVTNQLHEQISDINREVAEQLTRSITTESLRRIDSLAAVDIKEYIIHAKNQYSIDERNQRLIKYIGFKAETPVALKETLLQLSSMGYTAGVTLNNDVVLDSSPTHMGNEFYSLDEGELHRNYAYIIADIANESLTMVREDDLLTLFQNINPANYKNLKLH